MKRVTALCAIAWLQVAGLLCAGAAQAQDMAGQWQGIWHASNDFHIVLRLTKDAKGALSGELYNTDQGPSPTRLDSVVLEGSTLRFSFGPYHYDGSYDAARGIFSGSLGTSNPRPLELARASAADAWPLDPSPHKIQMVQVTPDVRLEVLDWGGTGRPLILLAGLGASAHVFDTFAPKLSGKYHVYGITRRGYGASSAPEATAENYAADRLGDDVLAVMEALKIVRPVLMGHSIAGEELSSIGSRYPDKVAGLIYVDAGYAYAYYVPGSITPPGYTLTMAAGALQRSLDGLRDYTAEPQSYFATRPKEALAQLADVKANLAAFETELAAAEKSLREAPPSTGALTPDTPQNRINAAVRMGAQKYTDIPVPVLALFALPHQIAPGTSEEDRANSVFVDQGVAVQADAFSAGVKTARVVRIANASHAIWLTNEADVLREMTAFIAGLK